MHYCPLPLRWDIDSKESAKDNSVKNIFPRKMHVLKDTSSVKGTAFCILLGSQQVAVLNAPTTFAFAARSFSWSITGHFIFTLVSSLCRLSCILRAPVQGWLHYHLIDITSCNPCTISPDSRTHCPQKLVIRSRVLETIWNSLVFIEHLKLIIFPLFRAKHLKM